MDLWSLISLQITLFILMMVGALLKKTGVIGAEGKKTLSDLCIKVVIPCNIFKSFLIDFTPDILKEIEGRFAAFLAENLPKNPLKCEYFLPLIPNQLIAEGKAKVRVLPCPEKWYGVTYQPDMPQVQAAIAQMKKDGLYPLSLWK